MKYLKYTIIAAIMVLIACEQNDPIADLGTITSEVPNVYMAPLNPSVRTDTPEELKIQYWSTENKFNELGLFETVNTSSELSFKLEPSSVNYEYSITYSARLQDETQISSEQHDLSNWVTDENAYLLTRYYQPIADYKMQLYTNSSTSKIDFETHMPDTLAQHLHIDLANVLNKTQLSIILVDHNAVMTATDFDACFNGDSKTESGLTTLQTKLKEVAFQAIVGDTYELKTTHRVTLRFRISNTNNNWGSSGGYGFDVI